MGSEWERPVDVTPKSVMAIKTLAEWKAANYAWVLGYRDGAYQIYNLHPDTAMILFHLF